MVTHHLSHKTNTFSHFDRFSKFVLIGNNIDGYVNIDVEEFSTYDAAIDRLPKIFKTLDYAGEWNIIFYQVPDNWKMGLKYGYYKVPQRGKKVFQFGYMECGDENEIFMTHALIHITSKTKLFEEKWDDDTEHLEINYYEEYYTTILKEDIDQRTFSNQAYKGDFLKLHKEAWG